MDTDAARRARRKSIKADLAEAYDDDEASPPEWVDLLERARAERASILSDVERATEAFVGQPDIKRALAERERFVAAAFERIAKLNAVVTRLNLLVPHARFTRSGMDAEETLRPLFRSARRTAGDQS